MTGYGFERKHAALADALREQRGLSREQLAVWAGTSSSTVYRIEHGQNFPTFDHIVKLAGTLGVTLGELCTVAEGAEQ